MKFKYFFLISAFVIVSAVLSNRGANRPAGHGDYDWSVYNGGPGATHYSPLDQINAGNVRRLKLAWRYDTGDAFKDSEMEANPIIVHGVLYTTSPKLRVIALDAATGKLLWSFDPFHGRPVKEKQRNRGVTYWSEGRDSRIFFVAEQYLYALDATTGKPVASFGRDGRVDLRDGLGRDPATLSVSATSPGIIYKDLLIMGSLLPEDLPCAPGDIRAYDVRTGKICWTFHTIPHPGEFGYGTWPKNAWKYIGGANNWAGMTLDAARGLVFASTGSAAFDFYGANRVGDDLFANCVLALNAETGKLVWHFQGVKHDVWDRDFPAQPVLVTIRKNGRLVDAVAQITKSGFVFVLDRATGRPLFPVEYRKVPASDVDGEKLAETQPFPLEPPPFTREEFSEADVTDRTPAAHLAVLERMRKLRHGGQFIPPSREGTVIFPGFDGGGEWGGPAFDPETRTLYINANVMAWVLRLVPRPRPKARMSAHQLYLEHCASCHREDLRGTPPEFPSLVNIGRKFSSSQIARIIAQGRGRMPSFGKLNSASIRALADFLATGANKTVATGSGKPSPIWLKYRSDGYNKFLDPEGYPAIKPPWGTLNALDLGTGKYTWGIPLGEWPQLAARGIRNTGSENYGGPLVTAGGLLFIAATTHDHKFRAFDKRTGKLLWETTLPAAGTATPATYEVDGRQYVVIGAGGGKWGELSGGSYLAFRVGK
jgi:glucose dehydrogenase